ncbi:Oidioi.mRNA.OKI2018_I69.chr1.g1309.t1.cds [Oikopleura dioica]|uniref:Oidioi.mRNA.OKI2018_I69.chr1.g1309.t1.cds n=1 Tax=Oikopleura dioica TaxID=34765 RepID=A0ABN7SN17_OIKDI|nr:Oidioi.mRNA.OKI2018_I69.chr1.g1309.t1.cds [Oikopleura dioica]
MSFFYPNPREKLTTARIMQLNVINTTASARQAQDPNCRPKINESDDRFPARPKVHDLMGFLLDYAKTITDQANNMKIIGKLIKQDLFYEDSEEKKMQKHIIQNMFDGMRYSAPLLKNLTAIKMHDVDSNAILF